MSVSLDGSHCGLMGYVVSQAASCAAPAALSHSASDEGKSSYPTYIV
jgi:hypothetical protein